MRSLALHTLCQLPVSIKRYQQEKLQDIVILILENFRKTVSNRDDILVLKRISILVEHLSLILPLNKSMSKSIVTEIFAIRCHSRFSEGKFRELWSRCLKCVTNPSCSAKVENKLLELKVCDDVLK